MSLLLSLLNFSSIISIFSFVLADNKSIGGHLLDFKIEEATVYLQPFTSIEQHLPIDNQEFLNKDLDIADMHDQIQKAEG